MGAPAPHGASTDSTARQAREGDSTAGQAREGDSTAGQAREGASLHGAGIEVQSSLTPASGGRGEPHYIWVKV